MQVGRARSRTELLVLYFVGCFTVCGSRPWMEAAFPGPTFCGASFCSISFPLFFFFVFSFLLGPTPLLWGKVDEAGEGGWPATHNVIVVGIMAFKVVQKFKRRK
ncbi:hypothetical protein MUK42_03749 [Musa troglodytarum]|uniref:Uncharacterized protein n=1 Tax=Musa troglodytarum TaxID=320322 RepID=A0A9E7GBX9_9LILI|nr:hypothetical protein MUK42_03749 [Musa troglodytarum]